MLKKNIAVIAVLLAGVFGGTMPLFIARFREIGINSVTVCGIRYTVTALSIFIALAIFNPKSLKIKLKDLPLFVLIGTVCVGFMGMLYTYSIGETSAPIAAILLFTSPIFIMIGSVLFLKEKFTKQKGLCLVLSFIGCALVSGITNGGNGSLIGIAAGLGSGILYGTYSLLSTLILRKYSNYTLVAYGFLFAAITAAFFVDYGALEGGAELFGTTTLDYVIFLIISGLTNTTVSFVLFTYGLKRMDASKAGILSYFEPICASFFGIAFLGDAFAIEQIIGVLLIVGAIVLLNVHKLNAVSDDDKKGTAQELITEKTE